MSEDIYTEGAASELASSQDLSALFPSEAGSSAGGAAEIPEAKLTSVSDMKQALERLADAHAALKLTHRDFVNARNAVREAALGLPHLRAGGEPVALRNWQGTICFVLRVDEDDGVELKTYKMVS